MRKRPITTMLAVLALVGLVAASCSGGDDGGTASSDSDSESDSESESTTAATGAAAEWEEVVPGGDCQCSNGSEFRFWKREADPTKVLLFFAGGGACWSAETCAQDGSNGGEDLYDEAVDEHPSDRAGIFDLANESNPFADYSMIYVPYCTADVFIGNATTEYAPGLTIQHMGYVNGTAAVDHLATAFPEATEVVVVGLSAGSVGAPLYGGLVADRFPDARITVLADSSGSYPASAASQVATAWGTADAIPDWPENAGLTAEQWSSPPGLFVQSGRHDPDITFARFDYAYDEVGVLFNDLLGVPTDDLLSLIDANEAQIEVAGVNLASYTAAGEEHGVVQYDSFYTAEVDGQTLVDWVTRLVEGEPLDDVRCTQCEEAG